MAWHFFSTTSRWAADSTLWPCAPYACKTCGKEMTPRRMAAHQIAGLPAEMFQMLTHGRDGVALSAAPHLGQFDEVRVFEAQSEVLQPHARLLPPDHAIALVVCVMRMHGSGPLRLHGSQNWQLCRHSIKAGLLRTMMVMCMSCSIAVSSSCMGTD